MQTSQTKVPAHALQVGDVLRTGEAVISVVAGTRTPRGKVEVTIGRDGWRRMFFWGANTQFTVTRGAE